MTKLSKQDQAKANACQPWGTEDEYYTNEELAEMHGTDPQDEANAEQDACNDAIGEWPF